MKNISSLIMDLMITGIGLMLVIKCKSLAFLSAKFWNKFPPTLLKILTLGFKKTIFKEQDFMLPYIGIGIIFVIIGLLSIFKFINK